MLYDIRCTFSASYDPPAGAGRHVVRLMPAQIAGRQRLVSGILSAAPGPTERSDATDFFGNRVTTFVFRHTHAQIDFDLHARVERLSVPLPFDYSPDIKGLAADIEGCGRLDATAPHHFTGPSQRVRLAAATTRYAREVAREGESVLSTIRRIGEALHADMRFDTRATMVDTPMEEAFAHRHGVCQDFTHVMIACLRGLGIPAGYVSGFLRTYPPEGQPRLEGADAMHAWVSAWCGVETGWVEYDPTNAIFADTDHVAVAHGRDYADIAPVKGVLRSSGSQRGGHSVDMKVVG